MSKAIYYIKNDFSAVAFLSIRNSKKSLIICFSTMYMRLKSYLMGVNVGKKTKWGGITQIERFPMSEITIGKRCVFNSNSIFNQRGIRHCIIQTGKIGAKIKIGNHCGFSGVSIVADSYIEIGNNVIVGANTIIGDRDGHPEKLHTVPSKIYIGNNVFIGMHCKIMKGVSIGKNSIIGAGSIVTKDIPENVVAVGIPCKVIKVIN